MDPQSWRSDEAWYSLITILRMLKLRGKKREIANNMEDHLKAWKENENFRCKYSHVVDYALNVLKLDVTEDDILKTITSSYTNDFSFMMPTGNQVTYQSYTHIRGQSHLDTLDVPLDRHDEPLLPALRLQIHLPDGHSHFQDVRPSCQESERRRSDLQFLHRHLGPGDCEAEATAGDQEHDLQVGDGVCEPSCD